MTTDSVGFDPVTIVCRDGYGLGGHIWIPVGEPPCGTVVVNPATGVTARYYHRFARFLAGHGFRVLTYDYRGIGASRPASLRRSGIAWRDWGRLDFDAVVRFARGRSPVDPLTVVGHSIGGFLPGFAESAVEVDRFLTVGAQYAYWADYAAPARARLLVKWHLAMPLLTAAAGYFPGRRLGWLEDLPKGVANEWSFRGRRMEASYPRAEREQIIAGFGAVGAPILAIGLTDDPLGTPRALRRALDYYGGSERRLVVLSPTDLGFDAIGHFGLFHDRHQRGFWPMIVPWLRAGVAPWPEAAPLPGSKVPPRLDGVDGPPRA